VVGKVADRTNEAAADRVAQQAVRDDQPVYIGASPEVAHCRMRLSALLLGMAVQQIFSWALTHV
jgi:hypothetical protein